MLFADFSKGENMKACLLVVLFIGVTLLCSCKPKKIHLEQNFAPSIPIEYETDNYLVARKHNICFADAFSFMPETNIYFTNMYNKYEREWNVGVLTKNKITGEYLIKSERIEWEKSDTRMYVEINFMDISSDLDMPSTFKFSALHGPLSNELPASTLFVDDIGITINDHSYKYSIPFPDWFSPDSIHSRITVFETLSGYSAYFYNYTNGRISHYKLEESEITHQKEFQVRSLFNIQGIWIHTPSPDGDYVIVTVHTIEPGENMIPLFSRDYIYSTYDGKRLKKLDTWPSYCWISTSHLQEQ